MTMLPTPEQKAQSVQELLKMTIQAREARITRLETRIALLDTLIKAYEAHVIQWAGVSFLESWHRYFKVALSPFNDQEWAEIRRIAKVTK